MTNAYNTAQVVHQKSGPSDLPTRVQFRESENQYFDDKRAFEECCFYWLTIEDYQRFRSQNTMISKTIVRLEKFSMGNENSYSNVLVNTYWACCEASESTTSILTEEEKTQLQSTLSSEDACHRLGLEQKIVRDISRHQNLLRRKIQEKVETMLMNEDMFETIDLFDEALRRECEILSKPCRMFAQQMAQAQLCVEDVEHR